MARDWRCQGDSLRRLCPDAARLASLAVLAALVTTSSARASDVDPAQSPLAEALFRDARRLMLEGKIEQACPKFEDSLRLDLAGGTAINLALCYEKLGRLAAAWTQYRNAIALAKRETRPDRVEAAESRARELEVILPRIVIAVSTRVESLADLKVTHNGIDVPKAAWNMPFFVDPGKHAVAATARDVNGWETTVHLGKGEATTVSIPALSPATTPPQGAIAATPDTTQTSNMRSIPVMTWIFGGIGAAGLALGATWGIHAWSNKSQANDACPNVSPCSPEASANAADHRDSARTSATLSTAALGVGVASLGIGTYFYFRAQKDPKPREPSSPETAFRVAPWLGYPVVGIVGRTTF